MRKEVKNKMNKWRYVEYDWALNLFYLGENPYWWGAVNIEYCKSSNHKRCLLAYYRARKNKVRRFKTLTKWEHIKKLNEEYDSHIKANHLFGGYYIH